MKITKENFSEISKKCPWIYSNNKCKGTLTTHCYMTDCEFEQCALVYFMNISSTDIEFLQKQTRIK